ncbi:VCBS repeat-containing protein [Streptomyces sp. NBC_00335]|uniref:FG-GAP repeat domain-containing protein n=1 Tax=unclassified Streptomyces TaxID=2593676 RepID=UPI0022531A18|nr:MULTISPECIES: VCBS repeat-containing protein [unclassified Streptomyces]MCX5410229.1 VCBS repeat-containing protein [Streptomyces sp. NBC_00086]
MPALIRPALAVLMALSPLAAAPPAGAPPTAPPPASFSPHTVDPDLPGAAFAVTGNVVGDVRQEIVATGFGRFTTVPGGPPIPPSAGQLAVYRQSGHGLDTWSKQLVFDTDAAIPFPNEPAVSDVDRDGDRDIVVPGGFFRCATACGSLTWWEQRRGSWKRHDIVPPGSSPLFYHRALLVDFDRDGRRDLVTVGESSQPVTRIAGRPAANAWIQVFRGTAGPERFSSEPVDVAAGGGALPVVEDVDSDGDLDLASPQYFEPGAGYVWLERTAAPSREHPMGRFARHVVDTTQGKAIALRPVRNLYGDGRTTWVGSNHTNTAFPPGSTDPTSQVVVFSVPADPRSAWTATAVSNGITSRGRAGQAAPGVFGSGDLDGDRDVDLLVSGDGDDRLFWLEQKADHTFATHVLASGAGQAGGAVVTDLDRTRPRRNEAVFTVFESNSVMFWTRD